MNSLNEAQRAVVLSESKRLVVNAGAGSGKSSTLIARVAHRVDKGLDSSKLWLITFTQAGAKVMADKLKELCLVPGFVGTRHALCYRLINRFGKLTGFRAENVTIVGQEEADAILTETAKRLGYRGSQKALAEQRDDAAKMIWKEMRHTLRRQNCITYDMALSEGLNLLLHPKVIDQLNVDEMLCDEAQDNSGLDWKIDYSIPAETKVWIGDEDQSIFVWRGADPQYFKHAAEKSGTEVITLELNYRSDALICLAANALISNNTNRTPKLTQPVMNDTGEVKVLEFPNGHAEAYEICIAATKAIKDGVPAREIAVLSRTNDLANNIRGMLGELNVPLAGKQTVELPHDWSLALATFAMTMDPRNDVTCERWMRAAGVEVKRINVAKMEALTKGIPMMEVWKHSTSPRWEATIPAAIKETAKFCGTESRVLIEQRAALLQANATPADLLIDLWQPQEWSPKDQRNGIHVGSVHSAKGKEFDMVFVAGCEEGTFPSKRGDVSEERRLCFVAITRARHALYLTWARQRTAYGKTTQQEPSRFLKEIQLP